MAKNETDPRRVKVRGRVSFAAFFKPNKFGHYGCDILVPKDEDISEVRTARKAAMQGHASFGPNEKKWPKGWKNPIKDGDGPKFADQEGYADHWVIRCKADETNPPQVVGRNGKPWPSKDGIVSGDYCYLYLYASAFDQNGNKGAKFNLDAVQFVEKGEPLSKRAQLQFDPISGDDDGEETESDEPDESDEESDEDGTSFM